MLNKKCSIPVPIELIAVVGGTLVSRYCNLPETYDIEIVGHIPTGCVNEKLRYYDSAIHYIVIINYYLIRQCSDRLPRPEVPTLDLLPLVAVDSIAITMVSYTITMSMALIFAQKLNYEIDSNQELLAMVRHLSIII